VVAINPDDLLRSELRALRRELAQQKALTANIAAYTAAMVLRSGETSTFIPASELTEAREVGSPSFRGVMARRKGATNGDSEPVHGVMFTFKAPPMPAAGGAPRIAI